MFKYFLIVLLTFNSFASNIPLESMLKNSPNDYITKNTVILKFQVSSKSLSEDHSFNSSNEENKDEKLYLKTLIHLNSENQVQIHNYIYKESQMNSKTLVSKFNMDFLDNDIEKNQSQRNVNMIKQLFYSTLSSLSLNRSNELSSYLKKFSNDFIPNSSAVNKELLELLNKYKNHLELIKNNPELKNKILSPLKSQNQEEQAIIDNLLKEPFYKNFNKSKLIKVKNNFLWQYKLDEFIFEFSAQDHQLNSILFENKNPSSDVFNFLLTFKEYKKFNENNIFPKIITFKSTNMDKIFVVRCLEMKYVNFTNKNIIKFLNSEKNKVNRNFNLENLKSNFPLIL